MRRLCLVLGLAAVLAACGAGGTVPSEVPNTPITPSHTPTITLVPASATPDLPSPEKLIAAFKAAGLEAEDPVEMATKDYPDNLQAGRGLRFLVPSLCDDCGGRVFVIEDMTAHGKLRAYYEDLDNNDPALFSWVFAKNTVLLQINGELPEGRARQYEAVILDQPVPTYKAPTQTPRPTSTPVPPTATPEPIVLSGSGQAVTEPVDLPESIVLVTLEHSGRRNFIVTAFSDDSEESLVNAIGVYTGRRALVGKKGMFFEIKADGAWTLRIDEFPIEASATNGASGNGDWVTGYFLPTKEGRQPVDFTHNGERNFIVYIYCKGGSDLAQNEIGPVKGASVVELTEGPCFWDVKADGAWSIKPRE